MPIDVEGSLFDEVASAVIESHPGAFVVSEAVIAPPRFPTLSLVETVNSVDSGRSDSSGKEKGVGLTYTADVYSAAEAGAKEECKSILAVVSEVMGRRNFLRTMSGPVANAVNPTIYRMVARYVGAADGNGDFYRR